MFEIVNRRPNVYHRVGRLCMYTIGIARTHNIIMLIQKNLSKSQEQLTYNNIIILLSCYAAVMNANTILQVFIALTNYFFFNCHQIVTSMNSAQKRTNNLIGTMMNACHSLDL